MQNLRNLGFKEVNNDLFAEYSWYFRNALVRANYEDLSNGIYKTEKYLILFLSNLVLKENHVLKNREIHVQFAEVSNAPVNVPVNETLNTIETTVFNLIKTNSNITYNEIASAILRDRKTVQRTISKLKKLGLIERIGSDKTGHWKMTV